MADLPESMLVAKSVTPDCECDWSDYHAPWCPMRDINHECEWRIRFRNGQQAASELLAQLDAARRVLTYISSPTVMEQPSSDFARCIGMAPDFFETYAKEGL